MTSGLDALSLAAFAFFFSAAFSRTAFQLKERFIQANGAATPKHRLERIVLVAGVTSLTSERRIARAVGYLLRDRRHGVTEMRSTHFRVVEYGQPSRVAASEEDWANAFALHAPAQMEDEQQEQAADGGALHKRRGRLTPKEVPRGLSTCHSHLLPRAT